MMTKRGHTLLEILIAAALLAMVLVGATSVFRGGSDSFKSGTWRSQSQKRAQLFLGALKEMLEKANDSEYIEAGGSITSVASNPVFINRRWYNTNGACATVRDSCMYFNVNKPFMRAPSALLSPTTVPPADTPGRWSGVVLSCQNGTLHLNRNGNYSAINGNPFPAQFAPPVANFQAMPDVQFHSALENVESLLIQESRSTNGVTILIRVTLRAPRDARVINLSEEIRAKLLKVDSRVTPYP